MIKELAQIILAIKLSTASLPDKSVHRYAEVIQKQAEFNGVDPAAIIAIITHESQWRSWVISSDHEDYGFMQIRARYYKGSINSLLNGEHNIKIGAFLMKANKDFCRKKLNREPSFQEWMAGYTGSWGCKPNYLTSVMDRYKNCIENDVYFGTQSNCKDIYWPRN